MAKIAKSGALRMATLFERARDVIEKLLPVAEKLVTVGTVDEMVAKRLRTLSGCYGNSLTRSDRQPIDYTRITTHIAYMYRAFSAHADWVYKALESASLRVVAALPKERVRVACIGGGPGSDIAGVMKFASANGLARAKFDFTILDRQPAWDRVRRELVQTYKAPFRLKETFQSLNLANGKPWTDDLAYLDSDIFTLSFCLSEVWAFDSNGSVTFRNILK